MLTLSLHLALTLPLFGDPAEWGGFRGNNGTGIGSELAIPERLDVEQNLAWKVAIPGGYSSPAVAGERLYLTAAEGEQLLTLCLDRATGAKLWESALAFDGKRPGANSPAAPSPVTDGERVFSLFHSFGLVAHDRDGKELWRKPLGPFHIPHGLAASPALAGERLVVQVDQDGGGYLLALDAKSGKELWRTERPGVYHGYATPTLWTPSDGATQVIVAGSMQVAGYSLASGEKLWWADVGAWQVKGVPIVVGDRLWVNSFMVTLADAGIPKMTGTFEEVLKERDANGDGAVGKDEWDDKTVQMVWFVIDLDDDGLLEAEDWAYIETAGRVTGGLYSIRLGGKGDVTKSHVAWETTDRRGLTDASSPLVLDGILYMIKDGIFTALDAETGELLERDRVGEGDQYFASPVGAGDRVLTAGLSGQLSVIRAGKDWEVLSTTNLDEQLWSTPALAGEHVYVRSQKALYCFRAGDAGG